MKIKYIKNHTENNKSYDIKIGDEYFVLQIEFISSGSLLNDFFKDFVQYRVIGVNC